MRRRLLGGTAIVVVAWLAGAGQAQADIDVLFVDTTSDNSLTACTDAAADCSLRGAFANADDGDTTDTDAVIFDAQVFDSDEAVANEATVRWPRAGVVTRREPEPRGLLLEHEAVRRHRRAARGHRDQDPGRRLQHARGRPLRRRAHRAPALQHRRRALPLQQLVRPQARRDDVRESDRRSSSRGRPPTSAPWAPPANVFAANGVGIRMIGNSAHGHRRAQQPLRRQGRRDASPPTRAPTSTSPATSPTRRRATSRSGRSPGTRPPPATRAAT